MRSQSSALTKHIPILDSIPRSGELRDLPVGIILRTLRTHKSTATLALESPDGLFRVVLSLDGGDIIAASIEPETLRLGRLLHRSGLVSRPQLTQALAELTPEYDLSDVLVGQGHITAIQKKEALETQFRDNLFSVFLLREGRFLYAPQEAVSTFNMQLFFDTDELIAEGQRIAEEVAILARELEHDDHIYTVAMEHHGEPPSREQADILSLLDGRRSTAELFVLSPYERLETLRLLSQLLAQELIHRITSRPRFHPESFPTYPFLPEELEGRAAGSSRESHLTLDSQLPDEAHAPGGGRRAFVEEQDPQLGVFLSASSVLDVVDLSHVQQYGIATDIPLDGIVEAAGAEDDEHEQGDYVDYSDDTSSEESNSSGDHHEVVHLLHEPSSDSDLADDDSASLETISLRPAHPRSAFADLATRATDSGEDASDALLAGNPLELLNSVDDDWPDAISEESPLTSRTGKALHDAEALGESEQKEPPARDTSEEFVSLGQDDIFDFDISFDGTDIPMPQSATIPDDEPERLDEPIVVPMPYIEPPPRSDESREMEVIEDISDQASYTVISPDDEPEALEDVLRPGDDALDVPPPSPENDDVELLAGSSQVLDSDNDTAMSDDITQTELAILRTIGSILPPEEPQVPLGRLGRNAQVAAAEDAQTLNQRLRIQLQNRADIYNRMFGVIFAQFTKKFGRDRATKRFQSFFSPGNSSHPELFLDISFQKDGTIDAVLLLRNLETYPTRRPAEVLDSALNDTFFYLLRDIHLILDPDEQSEMMGNVVEIRNLLFKKANQQA